ncbi:MAG: chemotaxis protein CheB [Candidatus Methylacidiphilales bacterium]|nr:chemotaxis protein CheB [Candidatus Methylacidiphilales bacterium]
MRKRKSTKITKRESEIARERTHIVPPPPESSGPQSQPSTHVPIVGVGSSAGGLEALELLLSKVPIDSGIAWVVIQHMDPTQKGLLVEILQRKASVPVLEIRDGVKIRPNHVYVTPANKDVSIVEGVLYLLVPEEPRGLRLPVDFFFRALAADQKFRSIGVILSGMGSDGTLGLRSIKEQAGSSFAQDPESAIFDSMPRSAIAAEVIDIVAPAEDLVSRIIDFLKSPTDSTQANYEAGDGDTPAIEKVFTVLRTRSGHDFSQYKKSTMHRRIERRMRLHQVPSIAEYWNYLRQNPDEADLLFKELLIGVTNFFRDSEVWSYLRHTILPDYLAARPEGGVLRAWTVGCSTGEEAYSLAIIFDEVVKELKPARPFTLQIFATDLDKNAIEKARAGVFPANIAVDVSENRLQRYFVENGRGNFVIKQNIREMITFAPQNVIMHPPITRLDFLTCRNLLIYLDASVQKKLMPLFHYSLIPGGIMVLGSSETAGSTTDLFSTLAEKLRIYLRLNSSPQMNRIPFTTNFTPVGGGKTRENRKTQESTPATLSLQALADQVILQQHSPAAVLASKEGDILYVNGKTGKYLEPAAGKANWNIFAMAREGLSDALGEAFHRAVRQKKEVIVKSVSIGTNGGTQIVDVSIEPILSPDALGGMLMIIFRNVAEHSEVDVAKAKDSASRASSRHNTRVTMMAQELQKAHNELQLARTEMQTSEEELKSTNEELQSMNEELQSTNEELTTSREEMQSMNEELQTVNNELYAKVDELSRTGNDMHNLLNSTHIATLFLDDSLLVRRYTIQTARIIKLIQTDIGRPITDIVTTLYYPDLADDAREVLRTLAFREKQVTADDNKWFNVKIMPYRTQENRIDGVVVTFTDITAYKDLEVALRTARADLLDELENTRKHLAKQTDL